MCNMKRYLPEEREWRAKERIEELMEYLGADALEDLKKKIDDILWEMR